MHTHEFHIPRRVRSPPFDYVHQPLLKIRRREPVRRERKGEERRAEIRGGRGNIHLRYRHKKLLVSQRSQYNSHTYPNIKKKKKHINQLIQLSYEDMIMSNMMYIPLAAFQPLCVPPILSLSLLKKDWCLQTSYLSISSLFYILRGDQFVCTSSVDFQKSLKKEEEGGGEEGEEEET